MIKTATSFAAVFLKKDPNYSVSFPLIKNILASFLIVSCTFLTSLAQVGGRIITGTVLNERNEPLPGVTVTVKNTSNITTTASSGQYTLQVPPGKNTLVFTYVGYGAIEQLLGNDNTLNLSMKPGTGSLDEVVVVGYGTRRKETLTGAVSSVSAKTFENRGPISSPLAALQGEAPGVIVTRNSAQPGRENWNFQVRGATSTNGTEPLVIVDGLPIPGLSALNSFNPADIENISFLKDASASIYGARAAGGVVLITTKRAKSGKSLFEYNGSVSQKKIGLQPKLVDINGWGPMIKEARTNDGFAVSDIWNNYADMAIYAVQNRKTFFTKAEATALGFGTNFTDVKDFVFFPGTMQDVLWGNATSSEHQLSVASRGDKSGYRISLGYLNDGSLLQWGTNSNKRYNLRMAHDYQFTSRLKLETNISLEKNDIIQPSGIGAVLNNGIQPGLPLTTADGKPYVWGSGLGNATVTNIAALGGESKELNTRLNTNFNLTYSITKNLKAIGSAGYYYHNTDYKTQENLIPLYDYSGAILIGSFTPSSTTRNSYQRASRKETYYNLNGYLEWAKVFSDNHDLRAIAGAQYERDETNRFLARTLDVISGGACFVKQ